MYRLVPAAGGTPHPVPEGRAVVLGRAVEAGVTVLDDTISRRHAELSAGPDGLAVRDLGSSNGTFVNGRPVPRATLAAGDEVRFGSVTFHVEIAQGPSSPGDTGLHESGATIVRHRVVQGPGATPGDGARGSPVPSGTVVLPAAVPRAAEELTRKKLSLLLDVSTALSRAQGTDELLDRIADYVFQIMDVDRAAILLTEADGTLTRRLARDRAGREVARPVPRSIARRVVAERIAVVSDDAPEDRRFTGESIVMQNVRSAMCAPLIGLEGDVLGVLYVDNLTLAQRFGADDLEFLVAFSGIAAVAIENGRYAEQVRREAVARGNFERFFTPALAARIASTSEGLRLEGERRRVAVLFSDIRGFTHLTEPMAPEAVAELLSEYFTAMVECVFSRGGTLDKFIGDAVMAQWGAPVAAPDDADQALAAALDMVAALEGLNARWRARGKPELAVGIGLNAGDVFAGYVGSERRLEYTVLGDPVNLASRLCSAAAGGEILVSQALLDGLERRPPVEERPGLSFKGVSRAVRAYRVLGGPGGSGSRRRGRTADLHGHVSSRSRASSTPTSSRTPP